MSVENSYGILEKFHDSPDPLDTLISRASETVLFDEIEELVKKQTATARETVAFRTKLNEWATVLDEDSAEGTLLKSLKGLSWNRMKELVDTQLVLVEDATVREMQRVETVADGAFALIEPLYEKALEEVASYEVVPQEQKSGSLARKFKLRLAGIGLLGTFLAACASPLQPEPTPVPEGTPAKPMFKELVNSYYTRGLAYDSAKVGEVVKLPEFAVNTVPVVLNLRELSGPVSISLDGKTNTRVNFVQHTEMLSSTVDVGQIEGMQERTVFFATAPDGTKVGLIQDSLGRTYQVAPMPSAEASQFATVASPESLYKITEFGISTGLEDPNDGIIVPVKLSPSGASAQSTFASSDVTSPYMTSKGFLTSELWDKYVVLSSSAIAKAGNFNTAMALVMASAARETEAMRNMNVHGMINIVGVSASTDFDGPFPDNGSKLAAFKDSKAVNDRIKALGADIAQLWVDLDNSCGLGFVDDGEDPGSARSEVDPDCITNDMSESHEDLHNAKARHNTDTTDTIRKDITILHVARGLVAYYSDPSHPERRLNTASNPAYLYNGVSFGEPGKRDIASALRNGDFRTVAGYGTHVEPGGAPVPPTPNPTPRPLPDGHSYYMPLILNTRK